ncbi:MAG: hypothetical protein MJZ46_08550 [Bacteroidales bacterium]|nr:hypothetical protein [Bacteroidales bacterium]
MEKLYALFVVLNCGGFMISFVGIVLSCLWIMMAKGSKAWYERWEKAIYAFPDAYSGAFEAGAEKVAGFRIEEIDGFQNDKVSSWLWNTHGGAYSPSKINIAIGHLSLIIWCSTAFLHMSSLYCGRELVVRMIDGLDSSFCGMVLAFLWSIGLLLVWIYARSNLKSGVLQDN